MDFRKTWAEYKEGFGSACTDYWIGNDVINSLTSEMNHELRIGVLGFDCDKAYVTYSSFHVGDEDSGYPITVSGYSGKAGNSFRDNNGRKFSTFDRDNDEDAKNHCAKEHQGAWWYKNCYDSSLNGKMAQSAKISLSYMTWWAWKKNSFALNGSVMMIRPRTYN
ncbi:ficolin-2-like [Ostrea edulis]|uniref:ficolin-2-like n=1 Tax=Ostrea edulis TaxID=37623 RepID=UPI0024AED9FE|nr:ficolin-2-like [Ostrea edulis]